MSQGVSIIVPVYNEEAIIAKNTAALMRFLDSKKINYEIFLGNNGSTDRTLDIARQLEKKNPRKISVLDFAEKGVGSVFKQAVQQARYDKLVSVDMDLSTELEFIPRALKLLDNYDVVVGSKKMGKQQRSWLRLLPSSIFIFLVRLLTGMGFRDYSMAGKAYRRDVVLSHLDRVDNGTSYVIDIVYFAHKEKKRLIEIPVQCNDTRKSRFNILRESLYRLKNLIRLFFFIIRNP